MLRPLYRYPVYRGVGATRSAALAAACSENRNIICQAAEWLQAKDVWLAACWKTQGAERDNQGCTAWANRLWSGDDKSFKQHLAVLGAPWPGDSPVLFWDMEAAGWLSCNDKACGAPDVPPVVPPAEEKLDTTPQKDAFDLSKVPWWGWAIAAVILLRR